MIQTPTQPPIHPNAFPRTSRKVSKAHNTKNLVPQIKKPFIKVADELPNFPKDLRDKLASTTNIMIFKECLLNPEFQALMKKKADSSELIRMMIRGRIEYRNLANAYLYMNRIYNAIEDPESICQGFWTVQTEVDWNFETKKREQPQSLSPSQKKQASRAWDEQEEAKQKENQKEQEKDDDRWSDIFINDGPSGKVLEQFTTTDIDNLIQEMYHQNFI